MNADTDANVSLGAALVFAGPLNLNNQSLTATGDGTLYVSGVPDSTGGTVNANAGVVAGNGMIGGDLNNNGGTVAPGVGPGTLTIGGDYTQEIAATLAAEIGGLGQGSQYDLLGVLGTATVNGGTLDVDLINPFVPALGDAFTVLTAATVSGVFTTIDDADAPLGLSSANFQLDWLTDYDHAGQVELVVGVRGDMDFDGDVDFDDIPPFVQGLTDPTSYLATFGHGSSAPGDLDENGKHDFDDISGFIDRLSGGPLVTAGGDLRGVPEPSTFLLGILGLLGFVGTMRQRRAAVPSQKSALVLR